MKIFVLNAGSSSIKYRLFASDGALAASGLVERIGEEQGQITHHLGEQPPEEEERAITDHAEGLAAITSRLQAEGLLDDLGGIGHRVVHGGEAFRDATVIDDDVVARIEELVPLAPLHNPANLRGIEVARSEWPDVAQVAVFDTSFHASLPPHAYRYAVPTEYYERYDVRRYGFHGTSHQYVGERAAAHLERDFDEVSLITLHLGNGASAAAIAGGRSVDTSMGLAPLEGLVMGTRSGDLDPTVVFHLVREAGLDVDEVDDLLNRRSGLRGLCGDNDLREIEQRADAGDAAAELALAIYSHRLRKYIGAYTAVLGHVDAVVFTAGVGENSPRVRWEACRGLEQLGIVIDRDRNDDADAGSGVAAVQAEASEVAVLVAATDEERQIAQQTRAAITAAAR